MTAKCPKCGAPGYQASRRGPFYDTDERMILETCQYCIECRCRWTLTEYFERTREDIMIAKAQGYF